MSNKKEITVDVSAFGGALDGFKFFVQQVEYRSEFLRTPTVHMQVLGVLDSAPIATPAEDQIKLSDMKLAVDALKSAAEAHGARKAKFETVVDEQTNASIYGRAVKAPVPEGVSIHHDLERRFTVAYQISTSGRLAFVGVAYCSPHDQFCRRTGRELAISRLDERPCRVVKLPRVMAPGTDDYPKNGAEWRAVEQSILLGLGLLR